MQGEEQRYFSKYFFDVQSIVIKHEHYGGDSWRLYNCSSLYNCSEDDLKEYKRCK